MLSVLPAQEFDTCSLDWLCGPGRIRTYDLQIPTTQCYHSQTRSVFTSHSLIFDLFVVVLTVSLPYWNSCKIINVPLFSVPQFNGNPYSYLYMIKFQLRYHPFSLYTIIRNNVRYGTIPSHRIFNILSDSLFSLGIVLHLLFCVKQHQKSSMSENAVLLVSLLDLYHFKDFHRI